MQSKSMEDLHDQQVAGNPERLNKECYCVSLDRAAMRAQLSEQARELDLYKMITEERPHLFAESAVFVTESCLSKQHQIIAAIENVIALPAFQALALRFAPSAAHFIPKASGVFLGFDFHLSPEGPKLIEINTNAGGAMLNVMLAKAQLSCCELAAGKQPGITSSCKAEQAFMAMFLQEWRAENTQRSLKSIAIVDTQPQTQFMLPEFILFQKLFERNGITAVIADPSELDYKEGQVWYGHLQIDLIYNRLTDFGLTQPEHHQLRDAYLNSAVVLTPHPRNHALYADKRNLALLTDETTLLELDIDEPTRTLLLQGIAQTRLVKADDADWLWKNRKQLFFKPARGYGSKAAYRGDKMTHRVFDEILQHDYVAQKLVQPSERQLEIGNEKLDFKVDLRNYVYQRQVQWICARLYQGQTTNFRTPGGGFAQVVAIPDI
jgi:hypothetical protein